MAEFFNNLLFVTLIAIVGIGLIALLNVVIEWLLNNASEFVTISILFVTFVLLVTIGVTYG